ncbi:Glutamyl-tRNA(Gln) amidotransferase subunit B mitochondrial [Pyrenophora tritici-repentis]|nr:Glutamyl-tRNA(Gln) amidotransferase subunit B mitochondrial [Pyrenophora tritici-repentis]
MLARTTRASFAAASKRPYIYHSYPITLNKHARTEKWELTVGIEVHAELNTARKLFSKATTSVGDAPNTHAALFDVAFPGSQPIFQLDTLVPALRAALAFQCEIPPRSSFDRKHYFYQDQPNGYQITQYYEPFAKNGRLVLYPYDFPPDKTPQHTPKYIGIKQIQMEQDTAKTIQQPPSTHLLDFNRVSHPLIEIITMPEIHDPIVAAATARKIQMILKAVNACTTGMELGGLRADVNVSVRCHEESSQGANHSYHGVTGLGQRTEIKNLSSFKAVEDAIIAERDRQIDILESGGIIEGETRGWTLGSTTTKRLRSKEGEIDYRYMPDPDIAPIIVSDASTLTILSLIEHLRETLPMLPDELEHRLTSTYSLTAKDAMTLLTIDDGERMEYFLATITKLSEEWGDEASKTKSRLGKMVGDWVLMELGSMFKQLPWDANRVPPNYLADVISHVYRKVITSPTGKRLLAMKFEGDERSVAEIVKEENLALHPLSEEEYREMAQTLLERNPEMVMDILRKGQTKKISWFVGQMMAEAPKGSMEPNKAKEVLEALLGLDGKVY